MQICKAANFFFSKIGALWPFKDAIRKITFNIDAEAECREDHPIF